MKVLHIGNLKSGIDTYVRNTVAYADNRFEYVIINGADDNSKPYIRHGRIVRQYSICMYRALNPIKDIKAIIQAIKIIKKENPDIVHCHSAKGGVIGRMAAFLTGTKSLYTPHAFSFLSAESNKKRIIFLLLERIAKLNSKLLACSNSEKEIGVEKISYNKNDVYVWANAIPDIKSDEIQRPKSINPNDRYIISIGRPSYQKNPLLMVETMNIIHQKKPEIKFYLVGVGYYSPMLNDMECLIRKYHLENVIKLLPWCSHEETLGYLEHALMYMTTSLYEGLPIAVLEAMAMRKAIVSSNVIGNNDCVKNKYNGYLLPMDEIKFADKCCELIDNKLKREEMGNNSRSFFESHFMIENRISELENIYLAQLKEKLQ